MKTFPIVIEINLEGLNDLHNLFKVDPQTRQVILDSWKKRVNALLESRSEAEQVNDPQADSAR